MNTLFEKFLYEQCRFLEGKKVIVAFSGGKDSVSLLYFLANNKCLLKISDIVACHINHQLRKSSERDEKFALGFCKKLGLKIYVFKIDVYEYAKKYNLSIEDAARNLRYNRLNELLENLGFDYILTAHHRDDLIENFFIRVFRGTPLYNLGGFNLENSNVKRPMLDIDRNLIDEFVNYYKLDFIVDESNYDDRFLRNWVRNNLMSEIANYNKGFFKNIIRLIDESKELKSFLDSKINVHILENFDDFKFFLLDDFLKLTDYEKKYFLMSLLNKYFKVEKRHIKSIIDIFNYKESKRVILPLGFVFEKSYKYCYLYKKYYLKNFEIIKDSRTFKVQIPHLNKCVVFKRGLKNKSLLIRNRRKGDRFLGKKLKDIFIDKKIDLVIRDTSVLVEENGNILWVENISKNDDIEIKYIKGGEND